MWVLDGELLIPWVKLQSGEGARGIAVPKPLVLEKGQEVEIAGFGQERVDSRAGIPSFYGGGCQHDFPERVTPDQFWKWIETGALPSEQKRVTNELLAEMGHSAPHSMGHTTDECACWCKGCNSGKHCHDQRCYPLYD